MAEDFEDAGQRYAFLLRPVKDLGKNFEVDIAKELDEYCERLSSVTEEAQYGVDNHHRFNFAEAAMLIQGSAFVFGRKVDYVHSQAVHFFESLQPQKSKKRRKKGEEEDEGFVDGDSASIDPCDLQSYNSVKSSSEKSLYRDFEKSKYRGHPPKIKVMPMSLMPLADNEKNGVLIYSTGYRKEVVGKMDDFKMNAGFLNNRGVLLLHLAHNKIVDDFASDAFVRMWHPYLFNEDGTLRAKPEGCLTLPASQAAKTQNVQSQNAQSQDTDSGRGSLNDIFAAGDNGRISSAMEVARRGTTNTFNDLHCARPSTRLTEAPDVGSQKLPAPPEDVVMDDVDSFSGGFDDGDCSALPVPCEKRPSRVQPAKVAPWEIEGSEQEDPTEKLLLDPFDTVKWKVKPVEKITRFVKGSTVAAKLEKQSDALYRFIVAVMRKRAEAKRESRKARAKPALEAVYEEDDDNYGGNDDGGDYDQIIDEQQNAENIPPMTGVDERGDQNKTTAASQNANNAEKVRKSTPVIELMFGDMDDDELNNSINIGSLYGGCGPNEGSQPIGDGKKRISLLELLHEHMLKYWSTAEEVTSDLVARVQDWEDTMMPILEEEETRKEFDIHEYGDELLRMFSEVGEVKTLDELLKGRKKYEVSRYFLACLMMANTYNVKVEHDVKMTRDGEEVNVMRITLLKKDRHHEVFDKEGAL
ncbi:unnamed protein product [Heligmosomoides polygyrus]|uniref:CNDH2_N domain-containing protein n=1 Tax=Heligmosomoides polygyrus TaxID=6339 RepID=A0A3P8C013_HELPZ|nr:unnamed protein product [Heligmosomoides polygyrus]